MRTMDAHKKVMTKMEGVKVVKHIIGLVISDVEKVQKFKRLQVSMK